MMQSYNFNQYESAAKMLYQLNCFLNGYGEGVQLEAPKHLKNNFHDRMMPEIDYRTYYEKYAPIVFKSMGAYIKDVLMHLERKKFVPQDLSEQDSSEEMEVAV